MANYNVDIALYIKGGVELDKLNKKLKQTQELQEKIERVSNGASSANYLRNKIEAEKDFVKFKKETLKASKKITDQEQKLFEITQKRGRAEREFGQEGNRLMRQKTAEFLKQQRLLLQMSRQYSQPIGPVASGVSEFRRDKARRQRAQFIASGAPGVPVAGAQQALPAFRERGLQILDNSVKLNESQLRIEAALNGERQRGVRFLEAQSREEKRQLDLGILEDAQGRNVTRSNLIPGVSSGKAVATTQHSRPIGPQPARAGGGRGGNRGLSNLALGVGFPLLFGGGVGSVAGGALGSVGGMGGQVLGSAIGGQIDAFIGKVAELGQALDPLNGDFSRIIQATGDTKTAFGRLTQKLAEVVGEEAALEAATKRLALVVGNEGVESLEKFGSDTQELSDELSKAFTAVAASAAGFINALGLVKATLNQIETTRLANKQTASTPEIKKLQEERDKFDKGMAFGGDPKRVNELNIEIAALQKIAEEQEVLNIAKQVQADIQAKINEKTSSSITLAEQEIIIAQNNGDLLNEQVVTALEAMDAEKIRLKLLEAQGDPLKINLVFLEAQLLSLTRINKIEIERDARKREKEREAAAAARKAAAEKEKEERKAKRLQQSIFNEDLKQLQIQSKINQLDQSDLEVIKIQKQELGLVLGAKISQVKLVVEDLSLRKEIIETLSMQASLELDGLDRAEEQLRLAKDLAELSAGAGFDVSSPFERNMKFVGGKSVLDTGPASFEEGAALAPLIEYEVQLDRILEKYPMIGEAATAAAGLVTFGVQEMIDGTKSAEQVFADFLNSIAEMLMKTAQQMIAQYIAIAIAKMFAGMGSGMSFSDFSGSMSGGNPFTPGGSMPFLLPPGKADGGPVSGGRPYTVGERGPELFVPGASGTIIPNHAMAGGANVTVNVDASGSNVEGDGDQAAQLGKAIGIAVQQELVKQKRPGGLLAR